MLFLKQKDFFLKLYLLHIFNKRQSIVSTKNQNHNNNLLTWRNMILFSTDRLTDEQTMWIIGKYVFNYNFITAHLKAY